MALAFMWQLRTTCDLSVSSINKKERTGQSKETWAETGLLNQPVLQDQRTVVSMKKCNGAGRFCMSVSVYVGSVCGVNAG